MKFPMLFKSNSITSATIALDVDGWLLGLHKELAIPSQPDAVVRIPDALLHPDGLLHLDLLEIAG